MGLTISYAHSVTQSIRRNYLLFNDNYEHKDDRGKVNFKIVTVLNQKTLSYLGLSQTMSLISSLPVPDGDGVVGSVVDGGEQRAAISAGEGQALHGALYVPGAQHRQRRQGY